MKKILVSIIVLFFCIATYAQDRVIKIAQGYQEKGYFKEASLQYEKVLSHKKITVEERDNANKNLGECYYALHNYSLAEEHWSLYLSKYTKDASLYTKFGIVLSSEGKKIEAANFYNRNLKQLNDKSLEQLYIGTFKWAENNKDLESDYTVLKTNINTGGAAMGITEWEDGLITCYAKLDKENQTMFYNLGLIHQINSLDFSEPKILSSNLSVPYYIGFPSVNKIANRLYFTANSSKENRIKKKKEENNYSSAGVNVLKIFSIDYKNNEWVDKEELSFNNKEFSCTHPSISKDGKTIYFISNMPGGYGGYDIYQSVYKNGDWTKPTNLGETVNTPLDEMTPFAINNILYFSSKGHLGYGGFDVYKVKINKNKFEYRENLGKAINSNRDDFSFYLLEGQQEGYLSSNREETSSKDYIYQLNLKPLKDFVMNIYFDYDKDIIKEESYPILDDLVDFLEANATIKIELSAHTDCIASDRYNLKLSKSRAVSAYKYLVEKGISKKRMKSKGYGKRKPLNTCEEQKADPKIAAKNRRLEVKIL